MPVPALPCRTGPCGAHLPRHVQRPPPLRKRSRRARPAPPAPRGRCRSRCRGDGRDAAMAEGGHGAGGSPGPGSTPSPPGQGSEPPGPALPCPACPGLGPFAGLCPPHRAPTAALIPAGTTATSGSVRGPYGAFIAITSPQTPLVCVCAAARMLRAGGWVSEPVAGPLPCPCAVWVILYPPELGIASGKQRGECVSAGTNVKLIENICSESTIPKQSPWASPRVCKAGGQRCALQFPSGVIFPKYFTMPKAGVLL